MITQGDHRRKQRPKEQMARRAPTADSRVSGASESSQPIPVTGRTPTMLSALSESDLARSDLTQQVALSYLVADMAAQDADVRRFRSDPETNLPSELLRWEDVAEWIDRHNRGVVGAIPALWLSEALIRDRQQREQLLLASREPDWSVLPDISISVVVPASEARA